MFIAPEEQLEAFLASEPEWMQRYFQKGIESLNQDELVEMLRSAEVITLTSEYERILQQMPARWKEYRKRRELEAKPLLQFLVPNAPPGRKPNDELAGRIWALRDNEGKTSKEIREILESGGESCSLELVESYFKKRRRKRGT